MIVENTKYGEITFAYHVDDGKLVQNPTHICKITKNHCDKPDCRICRIPDRYNVKSDH